MIHDIPNPPACVCQTFIPGWQEFDKPRAPYRLRVDRGRVSRSHLRRQAAKGTRRAYRWKEEEVSAKDWRPLIAEVHQASPWLEVDILPWIEAQIHVESRGVADAQSPAGARGLMQIMPSTAAGEFGVTADALNDPKTNIELGMTYLRRLYDGLGNRVPDDRERLLWAFASYNGGPAYARKALKLCRDDFEQFDKGSTPLYWKWDFGKLWYLHRDCCVTVSPTKTLRPLYRETHNYVHRIRRYHASIKGETQ